ncbi:MAG: PAM68 family protein [Cyanobium sp.]
MARKRDPRPFGAARPAGGAGGNNKSQPKPAATRQRAIPDAVANRMARRIAIATGIPTVMGMGVFIGSYVAVSQGLLAIPTGVTLVASGGCFLLGLLGLSYGVLSSSWEDGPGTLLGSEQIGLNIGRLRQSVRAMRAGSGNS